MKSCSQNVIHLGEEQAHYIRYLNDNINKSSSRCIILAYCKDIFYVLFCFPGALDSKRLVPVDLCDVYHSNSETIMTNIKMSLLRLYLGTNSPAIHIST